MGTMQEAADKESQTAENGQPGTQDIRGQGQPALFAAPVRCARVKSMELTKAARRPRRKRSGFDQAGAAVFFRTKAKRGILV
jgi:hypothetical protein